MSESSGVPPIGHIEYYDDEAAPPHQPVVEPKITLTARELTAKLEMAAAKKLKEISRDLEAQGYKLSRGLNGRWQVRPWDE